MGICSANIYIVALGSLGDVLPFLALGEGLLRMTADITVLSNSNYASLAERYGLRFESVAPAAPAHESYESRSAFSEYFMPAFIRMYDVVSQCARQTGSTFVIAHDIAFGALFAAEAYSIPCVRVVLSPAGLRTAGTAGGKMESAVGRNDGGAYREEQELKDINQLRRRLHLRPLASLAELEFAESSLGLGLFSKLFAAPLRNLPRNMRLVGFPIHRRPLCTLDEAVLEFIEREGNPIVFTPGTGARAVDDFFDVATGACRALDVPGIFLSSHVEPGRYDSDPRILVRKYIDLEDILCRASLAVHHGGIGTIAQCIQAEVPQIVCPRLFDQPDNARRVAGFGLGEVLHPEEVTCESLAGVARRLLRDAQFHNRAAALSKTLLGHRGIETAIEEIAGIFELAVTVAS